MSLAQPTSWASPPSQIKPAAAGVRLTLRDYQDSGLNAIRHELRAGKKAVLYVLPTGGGKTVTYAAMAAGAAQKGNRILILEHRKELIRQASLAVGGLGVKHQIVAPPDKVAAIRRVHVNKLGWPMVDRKAQVAVASVQTLARRMDWLKEYDPTIIVIDEAHHAVAGTWKRIIDACPDAILIGVTATPVRTDGQGLGDVFDSLVLGPTMQDLIDDGYLVPFRVFVPPRKADASKARKSGGDLSAREQAKILNTKQVTGDAVEHYRELAPGRPAIVFCADVEHATSVANAFKADGWRFEPVFGDMDDDTRDARINGLADGSLHGIVTVDIAGEGTDIPCAEVGIMLRLTESEGLFLQQAGRLTRTVYAPGFDLTTREGRLASIAASQKQFGLLIDHVGNVGVNTALGFVVNHGFPNAEREWTLHGRKKGPRQSANDEPKYRILQCPICNYTDVPRQVCNGPKFDGTRCKHVFEVQARQLEQVAGTLEEMDSNGQTVQRIQTGKARDMAALKAMGVSSARAQHIIAARAEKEKLQNELRDMLVSWSRATGQGVKDGWGFAMADIRDMKPKALRENIEEVGKALFHLPANENSQPGFKLG